MDNKNDGHRAYTAERKAKIAQLTEDLRSSDSLLTELLSKPDQTAAKYGLQLTQEEVSTIAAIAGGQELSGEELAAVAGGDNGNCNCSNQK